MWANWKKATTGRRFWTILVSAAILFCVSPRVGAQTWSGILTSNSSCTISVSAPGKCAIDWSTAGIPGGIPSANWTQSGSTILASTFGNGASDATNGIQTALNGCGTNHFILLGAGTFLIQGNLRIPSNCVLRGGGANLTILNLMTTAGNPIIFGSGLGNPNFANTISVTGGTSAGSTSITVSSAGGVTVGSYLVIDQQNDGTIVTINGDTGACTWCDGGQSNGVYAQGQISEVTSVSGTTIGINPGLFVAYTRTPVAVPFNALTKFAGVEALQVYANNLGAGSNFVMNECAYCWVDGVEGNYTPGDHVDIYWGYHDQVSNSYFSNSFLHTSGQFDSNVFLGDKTTGSLVQNNILERLHTSIMLNWGAAGNVIAYNYMFGNFDCSQDTTCTGGAILYTQADVSIHGAHPMFNLLEGNVGFQTAPDSIWGSNAENTMFRNWESGTTEVCLPGIRGPVACGAPGPPQGIKSITVSGTGTGYTSACTITAVGSGSGASCTANVTNGNVTSITVNSPGLQYSTLPTIAVAGGTGQSFTPVIYTGWYSAENITSLNIGDLSTGFNSIGNVYGSQIISSVRQYDLPTAPMLTLTPVVIAMCGPSPCGANSRGLFGPSGYNAAIGYSTNSSGGGSLDKLVPFTTLLSHGDFTSINNATTWTPGITQSLPPSFYMATKPSWWGSLAFPATGPDITSGSSNSFGHSLGNPAQACYQNTMHGTDGTGSPLTFNASSCYGVGSAQPKPAPATSLSGTGH